ncbi:MAG: glycosyltransferase [Bacteroidota bacterium]
MKILHINTIDKGGAATAIIRIHLALLERGIDSKVLVLKQTKSGIPHVYRFQSTPSVWKRIVRKFKRLVRKDAARLRAQYPEVEWFSLPTSPYDITEHPLCREADIIQLNWVSGFLDEPSFFRKNKKPVIWRMPDLYACGGGYHYEKGFPFQKLKNILDRGSSIRSKALRGSDITFVPISNWVNEKAGESSVIGSFPRQVIDNGLDFSIFQPMDKLEARARFDLPTDKKIILVGSDISMSERKGLRLTFEAWTQLDAARYQLVLFGAYEGTLPDGAIHTGHISDERSLATLYNAADVFCMSSIEEAFGQVTIEALACGVPVASFPNGGSLDIIRPGVNGVLARSFSSESLAAALTAALETEWNMEAIVDDTRDRFSIKNKIEQYLQLYGSVWPN